MKQLALCRKNIYAIIDKIVGRNLSEQEHKELKKALTTYVEMVTLIKWPQDFKKETRQRAMAAHLEDGEGDEYFV